eukprot:2271942-Pyramimonas_sp.AAC.3
MLLYARTSPKLPPTLYTSHTSEAGAATFQISRKARAGESLGVESAGARHSVPRARHLQTLRGICTLSSRVSTMLQAVIVSLPTSQCTVLSAVAY